MIIGCSNSKRLAKNIARKSRQEYSELIIKKFPDGETYLRFKTDVKNKKSKRFFKPQNNILSNKEIVLVNSCHPNPNDALIELLFAAQTAKELGAKKVTIVASYIAYLRQDKRFHEGECKSNSIIAELLNCADELITIDPHLHRIKSLNDIFKIKTKRLSANKAIADFIEQNHKNALIIGPDEESYQWAEKIAEEINSHAIILRKKRYNSRSVRIKLKQDVDFKNKDVVIVDDIISTGHTMIEPIKQLKQKGVKKITCICVHGLFVEDALERLKRLGVDVISTNTIESKVSKIDVSKLVADNL